MPGKGYSTIGLKPSTFALLKQLTERFYPGMFIPSTLIIVMNEVKLGYYSIAARPIKVDLSGRYNTLTVRSDVKKWLQEHHERLADEYAQRYNVKHFAHFVSYFLANLFESKFDSEKNVIRLKESDFKWIRTEYAKHKEAFGAQAVPFERFADSYINELFYKIKTAKEILST